MLQGLKGPDHSAPLMTGYDCIVPSQNWTYKIEYWTVLSSQAGNFHLVLKLHDPIIIIFTQILHEFPFFLQFQPFCCQPSEGVNNVYYIGYQELMSGKNTNKN